MNIKDIELRTGMTRANIRYYESLGLLSPVRSENGYRDYSEEDISALQKIKLLRSLEVSLEDIGALSRGEAEMDTVLSRQLKALEAKEQEMQQARELCRLLRADSVDYANLNASYYLDRMSVRPAAMKVAREKDKPPKVTNYVLRFFARQLDFFIYQTLINCTFLLSGVNIAALLQGSRILLTLLGIALMLFMEPLLLCTWGTTPGKWIMGLSVRLYNGKKLDYMDGMARTFSVICWGYGFFLPIYSIVRLIMSGVACSNEEELRWDDGCVMMQKDENLLRWLPLFGAYALCVGLIVLCTLSAVMPNNRGELSVEEFVENYNDYAIFSNASDLRLDTNGRLQLSTSPGTGYSVSLGSSPLPLFSFQEENGIMTGFTISLHCSSESLFPSSCANEILIASQSYINGVEGKLRTKAFDPLVEILNERPFEDFHLTIQDYELQADYSIEGYTKTGMDFLFPSDIAKEHSYSLLFTLRPVE